MNKLVKLKVSLDEGAYIPERAHSADAGIDLRTREDIFLVPLRSYEESVIYKTYSSSYVCDTGVHVEIPEGYVGLIMPKSGLNVKRGVLSFGVIDAGYSGSVIVKLYNISDDAVIFNKGDKISQLLIVPVETPEIEVVDRVNSLERGDNGFGSSGK